MILSEIQRIFVMIHEKLTYDIVRKENKIYL